MRTFSSRSLAAARETGRLDAEESESFDRLTRLASRLLAVPVALIAILDEDRQFFLSQSGLEEPLKSERQTPLSHSFCQHVVAGECPLLVDDASLHPLVKDNPAIGEFQVQAYLGVPLRLEGKPFGSLCVIDHAPRHWQSEDVRCLEDLAQTVLSEILLRKRARELESLNERQSQLMGVVAHDLRNPLGVLLTYIECFRSEAGDPETLSMLEAMARSTGFMKSLVDDLLDFESLRKGCMSLQLRELPVAPLVLHCVEAHQLLGEGSGVSFDPPVVDPEIRLLLDPRKVEQALNNLLGNGMKYCSAGCVIRTVVARCGDEVCLEVSDDGPGMGPEVLQTLFEPFQRAKGAGQRGHALGLAIVHQVMRAHGGRVEVRSEPGRGTAFRLFFSAGTRDTQAQEIRPASSSYHSV